MRGVVTIPLVALVVLASCGRRDRSPPAVQFRPVVTGRATEPQRSVGCATADGRPRGEELRTAAGRTFHVWGPSSVDPKQPAPVVFAFHGIGSTGLGFQRWFRMEDHVGGGAFVVYPDAARLWDLEGARDLDFFEAMLDELERTYCVDRARVFAFGFSFGAKLVHHLGCKRSARLRAIAVGDGSWEPEEGCARIPVLVTHRTTDFDERIEWGKAAATRWARLHECERRTEPSGVGYGCLTWAGCKPDGAVTFCEDTDNNPAWPHSWHHTVREEYRSLTWAWFQSVR